MPSPPPSIPNSRERSILQALIDNGSDVQYFASANPQTIERMIKKGWIVRMAQKLEATSEGRTAFARPIGMR